MPRSKSQISHTFAVGLWRPVPELRRAAIEGVAPEIDGGRFAVKRTIGETVVVSADIYADGHAVLRAVVLYRAAAHAAWMEQEMVPIGNDRWEGEFRVSLPEPYVYTVQAWIDPFQTWLRDTFQKADAGQDIFLELLEGAELVRVAADRAFGEDARRLTQFAQQLSNASRNQPAAGLDCLHDPELASLMGPYGDRSAATTYEKELGVIVDREKARFSAWYEMFPRSCAPNPERHGTFRDCLARVEYVAGMGFDVLYFPPIHPIGYQKRKGKNNQNGAAPGDPGSPWAIGSREGGHKAIHPQFGTLADFHALQDKARELGIEIALDLAFQCAPDHPYVRNHQEWFRTRFDGTVQYAENPPKKYEDIVPFDFESRQAPELCEELKRVVVYWIEQGVRIFRVDNPHTKPFGFWEWLIADIKAEYPDVIFLAEAFTRPKVMYRLAKLGFTQSYTYFAWKNGKQEIMDYFTEITRTPVHEFFRANLWPNTPDILNEYLQTGGKPAFQSRLILAATLGANYGIYGPAFELCESTPVRPGSEEYLDSEKYEIRAWNLRETESLAPLISQVNSIRRAHPALQTDGSLCFHNVDNDRLIAYSKIAEDSEDAILTVVNLNPRFKESGWLEVPLERFGLREDDSFEAHDLLGGARYMWRGRRIYVELDPCILPAHIFELRH